jgi:hypothetical protein
MKHRLFLFGFLAFIVILLSFPIVGKLNWRTGVNIILEQEGLTSLLPQGDWTGTFDGTDKNQADELEKEIIEKRGETYKVYDIGEGKKRYIIHSKPIHYKDSAGKWKEIDVKLKDVNNSYITGENKFIVEFKKNKDVSGFYEIKRKNSQFIVTPVKIILNQQAISLSDKFNEVSKLDNYRVKHKIDDEDSIWTQVHNAYVKSAVKTTKKIDDFNIVERIDLKGFKILNEKKGEEYISNKRNEFVFETDDGEKIWIPQPVMWTEDGNRSREIEHRLFEENGKLFYSKKPTTEGKEWLNENNPVFYLDNTNYYGDTSDGWLSLSGADWSDTRNATDATSSNYTDASYYYSFYAGFYNGLYYMLRSFFAFDTLGVSGTVSSATLYIYGNFAEYVNVCVQKGTQGDTLTTADWDAFTGSEYAHVDWNGSGYNAFSFNQAGKDDINTEGTTYICGREYDYDYLDVSPESVSLYSGCYYADEEGEDKDPYLDITAEETSTYDFTVSYNQDTCTNGKGGVSGTICSRIWLETTDTIIPIDQNQVVPDGQSDANAFIMVDFTGTAETFDMNVQLETALPAGMFLKANMHKTYPADTNYVTTTEWLIAEDITPSGTRDLNLWFWGDFQNYDVANGLDTQRTIDLNCGDYG